MTETIKFEIHLLSEFWNSAPTAQIFIDDNEKFNDIVPNGTKIITFFHTCDFATPHRLKLVRTGKTNQETKKNLDGSFLTQMLTVTKVKIDGIDVRDIVWSNSVTIPEYPEPWASLQKKLGHMLEEQILGGTELGHNCVWYLDFTSPFYKFIIKWMNGGME